MENNKKDIKNISDDSKYQRCLFVLNKTEKITLASYSVTNLLDNMEPMKWSIRNEINCLLDYALDLRDKTDRSEIGQITDNIQKSILSLLSFYGISGKSGILSKMNSRILSEELLILSEKIEEYYLQSIVSENKDTDESLNFGSKYIPTIFGIGKENNKTDGIMSFFSDKEDDIWGLNKIKLENKNTPNYLNKKGLLNRKYTFKEKSIDKYKGATVLKKNFIKNSSAGSDRKSQIVSIVKDKREVSIKDISDIIKDCSEKTIQRELISLVESGVLIKEGERRWSKYRIR